jgi:hypothetical protein
LAICNYLFIFAIVLGKKLFLKRSIWIPGAGCIKLLITF